MRNLCKAVLAQLKGKTLATAESCTGGGIGAALTAISGSSAVYKGGVISYTNDIKEKLLGLDGNLLKETGPVSAETAHAMATGVRKLLDADVAISVTGLAGPGGDDYGNPVGTVYIGYADDKCQIARGFLFAGDRESVRRQAAEAALKLILEQNA